MSSREPRRIIFAPRALVYIQDIFIHGVMTWGEPQARAYDATLREAIQRLADCPELGRARNEVRPGSRSLLVGEHVVFYETVVDQVEGAAIRVIRILHRSRHAASHVRE